MTCRSRSCRHLACMQEVPAAQRHGIPSRAGETGECAQAPAGAATSAAPTRAECGRRNRKPPHDTLVRPGHVRACCLPLHRRRCCHRNPRHGAAPTLGRRRPCRRARRRRGDRRPSRRDRAAGAAQLRLGHLAAARAHPRPPPLGRPDRGGRGDPRPARGALLDPPRRPARRRRHRRDRRADPLLRRDSPTRKAATSCRPPTMRSA